MSADASPSSFEAVKSLLSQHGPSATWTPPRQKKVTFNINKERWLLMKRVRELIVEHDATIFGGFVRDFYIKEHAAATFKVNKQMASLRSGFRSKDWKFSDTKCDPSTLARLLMPNDMDIFYKDDPEKLFEKLQSHDIEVEIVERIHRYGAYSLPRSLMCIKGRFSKGWIANDEIGFDFDIIVPRYGAKLAHAEPHFMNCDLECNGLLMDKTGICLSKRISDEHSRESKDLEKWQTREKQVLEDVLSWRTRFIYTFSGVEYDIYDSDDESASPMRRKQQQDAYIRYRIGTMVNTRGWKLISDDLTRTITLDEAYSQSKK